MMLRPTMYDTEPIATSPFFNSLTGLSSNRILRASKGHNANITGFNINRLKEAATKPVYDPWER